MIRGYLLPINSHLYKYLDGISLERHYTDQDGPAMSHVAEYGLGHDGANSRLHTTQGMLQTSMDVCNKHSAIALASLKVGTPGHSPGSTSTTIAPAPQ